jgi:hypothetical protein
MNHVQRDFTVTYPREGDLDYIRVGCVGVGDRGDHFFMRHDFNVGYYEHNPYSLVAKQWFIDHPPRPDWKVGDVVPKNTAVGKRWTAAPIRTKDEALRHGLNPNYGVLPVNLAPDDWCREDRAILWIEP